VTLCTTGKVLRGVTFIVSNACQVVKDAAGIPRAGGQGRASGWSCTPILDHGSRVPSVSRRRQGPRDSVGPSVLKISAAPGNCAHRASNFLTWSRCLTAMASARPPVRGRPTGSAVFGAPAVSDRSGLGYWAACTLPQAQMAENRDPALVSDSSRRASSGALVARRPKHRHAFEQPRRPWASWTRHALMDRPPR